MSEKIVVKTKACSPRALYRQIVRKLSKAGTGQAANFAEEVLMAVNLDAKNTKNFASKDLAFLQVRDLAKHYNVTVIVE